MDLQAVLTHTQKLSEHYDKETPPSESELSDLVQAWLATKDEWQAQRPLAEECFLKLDQLLRVLVSISNRSQSKLPEIYLDLWINSDCLWLSFKSANAFSLLKTLCLALAPSSGVIPKSVDLLLTQNQYIVFCHLIRKAAPLWHGINVGRVFSHESFNIAALEDNELNAAFEKSLALLIDMADKGVVNQQLFRSLTHSLSCFGDKLHPLFSEVYRLYQKIKHIHDRQFNMTILSEFLKYCAGALSQTVTHESSRYIDVLKLVDSELDNIASGRFFNLSLFQFDAEDFLRYVSKLMASFCEAHPEVSTLYGPLYIKIVQKTCWLYLQEKVDGEEYSEYELNIDQFSERFFGHGAEAKLIKKLSRSKQTLLGMLIGNLLLKHGKNSPISLEVYNSVNSFSPEIKLHSAALRAQLCADSSRFSAGRYFGSSEEQEKHSIRIRPILTIANFKGNFKNITAADFSIFISSLIAEGARPGFHMPKDLDFPVLFRGALYTRGIHQDTRPLRNVLNLSYRWRSQLIAMSTLSAEMQPCLEGIRRFNNEANWASLTSLKARAAFEGGLGNVLYNRRYNNALLTAQKVVASQHNQLQQYKNSVKRDLATWFCSKLMNWSGLGQRQAPLLYSTTLQTLLRWYESQHIQIFCQWPWADHDAFKHFVAQATTPPPAEILELVTLSARYNAEELGFKKALWAAPLLQGLLSALGEADAYRMHSPAAVLPLLAERVKAQCQRSQTTEPPLLREVLFNNGGYLLQAALEKWIDEAVLSKLSEQPEAFWQQWCQLLDVLFADNVVGVEEIHPPALELGYLEWLQAGIEEAQDNTELFKFIVQQAEPLHAATSNIVAAPNYSKWLQETNGALQILFERDETYYHNGTEGSWQPFLLWQSQLADLLPVLPTIAQVQEKLTATEIMVLLYEAKQALHALVIDNENVRRICLSDAAWQDVVQRFQAEFASGNNAKVIAAIEAGSQQAWAEHSAWHETVVDALESAIPEKTQHLYLIPGTASNLPWEWALQKQGCVPVTRLVSVQAYLATTSTNVAEITLVQGHIETERHDPDFTAMRALWTQAESTPVTSITETLLSLKEAQQLHYFGHGQTDANHGGGNYLSMASHKLFTRLLPLTDIHAGVINLSACYSAQSKHSIGLGHVLVGSGASHVIGCLWQAEAVSLYCFNRLLRDLSKSTHLTKAVFEQAQRQLSQLTLEQVKDWVAAAQSGQLNNNASYLEYLDINEFQLIFAHPYFWAGYVWLAKGGLGTNFRFFA